MAILADQDRAVVWAEVMRRTDVAFGEVTKSDLRSVVNAIDEWVDANSAAFNAAIPQPARGALSARQKAALLSAVVAARFIKG